ncbi:prominin-2 [Hippoglossus hippoglossus]|uniref:prominin-2 n=1 Tax=Hippoglossus hippoglossus TaxID=8267 RepID=UPI00148DA80A|nr:prominin-2 [Hippoglossus hippoglossus]
MGLCERMRGVWRPQGSAGALRACIGAMLLGLSLSQSTCTKGVAPLNLTEPEYQDTTARDTGLGFMAPLVQSFLHTVQPNPFPEQIILKTINSYPQVLSDQELIKEALVYEVGFLVCAAIGILYIVLMPIVGFFLACCRCCGNCGGMMYQKQTSSIDCRRRTLYWSTLVTTLIILAGNICMFRSNAALKMSVDETPVQLNKTLDNIQTFLTAVPQQIHDVVNESYKTIQEVTRNLDAIGPQLGTEIQKRFTVPLDQALLPVRSLNQETGNITVQLKELNSSLARLQSSTGRVQGNITDVKDRINRTLSNPLCLACVSLKPDLQTLPLDISATIPIPSELQSAVDEVVRINLPARIEEVESFFDSIPQTVANETEAMVQNSKQLLGNVEKQISEITTKIPLSGLTKISEDVSRVHGQINSVTAEVKKVEYIRWGVCVALCCVVLLVVVCNLLGLVLGPLGLSPSADPTKRSCTADSGGTFLVMGAGFSFLFSWLFMIVVVLLFLVGGNVYILVCRPWNDGQLLKLIDSSNLSTQITQTLGLETKLSFSEIYRDCQKNKPVWTTLHLSELINLDETLNVSKYTEEIKEQFENTDIPLSTITLLSPEVINQLSSFSSKANGLDSSAITQQINNISRINLNTTADKLDLAATKVDVATGEELRNEASDLRKIQASIESTIIPQLENLNSSVKSLQSMTEKINGTVGEVLRNVGAAQDFLNTNTTQIVKAESKTFLDCQLGYFTDYADWAKLSITQEVGRCQPIAGALDSAEIIVCEYVVQSLNAFWCSLGWCMIFFIPSIIFSIKLAKYYRRMKRSDVYDEHIVMNHIPRAQMKIH